MSASEENTDRGSLLNREIRCGAGADERLDPTLAYGSDYASIKRTRKTKTFQLKQQLERAQAQLAMLEKQRSKFLAVAMSRHGRTPPIKNNSSIRKGAVSLKIRIPGAILTEKEHVGVKRPRKDEKKKGDLGILLPPPSPGLSSIFGRKITALDLIGTHTSSELFSTDASLGLSALCTATPENLVRHVQSLRMDFLSRVLRPLLRRLMISTANRFGVFNNPVDPIASQIPNYFELVPNPMDLGTIKGRLQALHYQEPEAFAADVRLVFKNAITFNHFSHPIHQSALTLLADFETEYAKVLAKLVRDTHKRQDHHCHLCQGQICALCGDKCLQLEPPVLICHGPCASRIRRGGVFYVTPDALRLWCSKCFVSLPQELPDECGNCTSDECDDTDDIGDESSSKTQETTIFYKRQLLKRKFDEDLSEAWVQCDRCKSWIHEVCGLFNSRANVGDTQFTCPVCLLKDIAKSMSNLKGNDCESLFERAGGAALNGSESGGCTAPVVENGPSGGTPLLNDEDYTVKLKMKTQETNDQDFHVERSPSSSVYCKKLPKKHHIPYSFSGVYSAAALPRTSMGDFIEHRVLLRLEKLGMLPNPGSISIRVVSNMPVTQEVSSAIRRTFKSNVDGGRIPKKISYVSKALCMFQKIDGADVCLFSMYIQEHGADAPCFNSRRVYIAYLDSIEYFRPRTARTHLYHEILASYLDWARRRGFSTAHIWSCPPQRGNNFIFWCHPEHQRTPTRERLMCWYRKMLLRCEDIGIVKSVENFHSTHFQQVARAVQQQAQCQLEGLPTSIASKPLVPPIFDGDYWLDEFHRLYRLVEKKSDADFVADQMSPLELCRGILTNITSMPQAAAFREPVDPELHHCLDYFMVIKRPMDLSTVSRKLQQMDYASVENFAEDMRLIFSNGMTYNPPRHPVHGAARHIAASFERSIKRLLKQMRERIGNNVSLRDINFLGAMEEIALADEGGRNYNFTGSVNNTPSSRTSTRSHHVSGFHSFSNADRHTSTPSMTSVLEHDSGPKSTGRSYTPHSQRCRFWSGTAFNNDTPLSARDPIASESFTKTVDKNESVTLNPYSSVSGKILLTNEYPSDPHSSSDIPLERGDSLNTLSEVDTASHSDGCSGGQSKSIDESGVFEAVKNVAGNKKRWILSQLCKSVDLMKRDLLVVTLAPPDAPLTEESWDDDYSANFVLGMNPHTCFDPDSHSTRALVGSRHTFLEMCQFRHYQFDTLRRAKHSSAMVLYHLHRPEAYSLNLFCFRCKQQMCSLRHHCTICFIDMCTSCEHEMNGECEEGHQLTPFRVTFVSSKISESSH